MKKIKELKTFFIFFLSFSLTCNYIKSDFSLTLNSLKVLILFYVFIEKTQYLIVSC